MTVCRWNFFGLFWAANAAPLLSLPTFGKAAGMACSKSAMHGATMHAQVRVSHKN